MGVRSDVQKGSIDQVNRSFAEAVRKNMPRSSKNRDIRNVLTSTMSWFGSKVDEEWLLRSAISLEIKVKGAQGVFSVRLEEDSMQVYIEWVNQFLGLHPPEKMESFPITRVTGVTEVSKERVGDEWGVSAGSRV
ncbi:hypothetical protein Q3G72_026428 [Acer saccharum]|nr:hypothetical protein Q3G72_026428 [Acer saccharum]